MDYLDIFVHLCVIMYIHVCMYVCMNVCMNVCACLMKVWMYKTMAQIRAEILVRGRPENFISQSDAGGIIGGVGRERERERESFKGVESNLGGGRKNRA